MKTLQLLFPLFALSALVLGEPPSPKRSLVYRHWPPKGASGKQVSLGRGPNSQQKTLVVQIRSDQPVPLVLKGRPGHGPAHVQHGAGHLRGPRPVKLTGPIYLKHGPASGKQFYRKPLKIKLPNGVPQHKPATAYGAPFKYEQPSVSYSETQKLPFDTHANFHNDHFTPIHTIPAPNLALHDNHLPEETYLPPSENINQYQVLEQTNDHTLIDPFSGSQKLFAPDPDPSLPTSQIRPATEPYNRPSNGKPLPVDVQSNYLLPAQPLVQIVGAQQLNQQIPEIYPVQAQLQQLTSAPAASVPLYNPTYLVTQSNNLYTQHQQQLFQPTADLIQASYPNVDLTQEVASNGQILQAAKDHHVHPVLDIGPQFAALIAAPALGGEQQQQAYETAPFHLTNVAAAPGASESGFVVSKYYGNAQDSSQLLQAYAEEEAQRQQFEEQLQQQEHLQQLQQQEHLQQQQQHLQQLQQQEHLQQQQHLQQLQQEEHLQQLQLRQEQEQEQEQQQLLLQQQHNHLLELQQQQQQQQQQQLQQQQLQQQQLQQQSIQQQARAPQHVEPVSNAFDEHQRLVQQQLGNVPLRIFVPEEESADTPRLQKRADNLKKGTVEDASRSNANDLFEVSSSVEVSSENQMDDASAEKKSGN